MRKVILIGSPNSGKSLLFNRLTGLHQKVANFPGVTVEVGSGSISEVPGNPDRFSRDLFPAANLR